MAFEVADGLKIEIVVLDFVVGAEGLKHDFIVTGHEGATERALFLLICHIFIEFKMDDKKELSEWEKQFREDLEELFDKLDCEKKDGKLSKAELL